MNATWIDSLANVISKFEDPALSISAVVILLLFYLVFTKEKTNKYLVAEMKRTGESLSSLTKLIEVLVYGRQGKND